MPVQKKIEMFLESSLESNELTLTDTPEKNRNRPYISNTGNKANEKMENAKMENPTMENLLDYSLVILKSKKTENTQKLEKAVEKMLQKVAENGTEFRECRERKIDIGHMLQTRSFIIEVDMEVAMEQKGRMVQETAKTIQHFKSEGQIGKCVEMFKDMNGLRKHLEKKIVELMDAPDVRFNVRVFEYIVLSVFFNEPICFVEGEVVERILIHATYAEMQASAESLSDEYEEMRAEMQASAELTYPVTPEKKRNRRYISNTGTKANEKMENAKMENAKMENAEEVCLQDDCLHCKCICSPRIKRSSWDGNLRHLNRFIHTYEEEEAIRFSMGGFLNGTDYERVIRIYRDLFEEKADGFARAHPTELLAMLEDLKKELRKWTDERLENPTEEERDEYTGYASDLIIVSFVLGHPLPVLLTPEEQMKIRPSVFGCCRMLHLDEWSCEEDETIKFDLSLLSNKFKGELMEIPFKDFERHSRYVELRSEEEDKEDLKAFGNAFSESSLERLEFQYRKDGLSGLKKYLTTTFLARFGIGLSLPLRMPRNYRVAMEKWRQRDDIFRQRELEARQRELQERERRAEVEGIFLIEEERKKAEKLEKEQAKKKAKKEAEKAKKAEQKPKFAPPPYPPAMKRISKNLPEVSNKSAQIAWLSKWAPDAWDGKNVWSAKRVKEFIDDKNKGVEVLHCEEVVMPVAMAVAAVDTILDDSIVVADVYTEEVPVLR